MIRRGQTRRARSSAGKSRSTKNSACSTVSGRRNARAANPPTKLLQPRHARSAQLGRRGAGQSSIQMIDNERRGLDRRQRCRLVPFLVSRRPREFVAHAAVIGRERCLGSRTWAPQQRKVSKRSGTTSSCRPGGRHFSEIEATGSLRLEELQLQRIPATRQQNGRLSMLDLVARTNPGVDQRSIVVVDHSRAPFLVSTISS